MSARALVALDVLARLPAWVSLLGGIVLTSLVAAAEIVFPLARFSVLFAAIVFAVAWSAGMRAAFVVAFVATGLDMAVASASGIGPGVLAWNGLARLTLLAAVAAATAMVASEVARLRRAGALDPQLGTLNRRAFLAALARARAWANRRGEPISILFIDVDGLKRINDSRGHRAGDAVIAAAAAALRDCIRADDQVGRLGGDEFAAVLRGGDADGARALAERIRASAAAAGCAVSIGCATFAAPIDADPEHLLAVADRLMYEAKGSGAGVASVAVAGEDRPFDGPVGTPA